jgi:outer membrane protein OmpA-like peptidoglycan-associated protein
MSVTDASRTREAQYTVDFLLTFLTDPFVIYNYDETNDEIESTRTDVISSIFAGQLVGAYGLTDDIQLGVSLPLTISMSGDGLDPVTGGMADGGFQASGFGDLRLEAKGKLMDSGAIRSAWFGGLTVPTSFGSEDSAFLGDDLPAGFGGVAAHWVSDDTKFRAGGNLGVMLRNPRTIYASEVGQQLSYGVAGAYDVTKDFSVITELFGRNALTSVDLDASPLEVAGGLRAQATRSLSVTAGGGAGLLSGIGSPSLRFIVAVGYAPDLGDTDNDGISNMKDKCPLVAEDMDDFEDSDGCPEEDNDGDRRNDDVDKCPNEKEDIDGFEDDDGCPEPDNDKDSILDANDRCPLDAEDGKAPYDKDGCPANKRDSDDDGVFDSEDQCPDDYEDDDNFEDWDGCPEDDNDRDGIPDEDDSCPRCPEDMDGFSDTDGCPDLDNDKDGILDSVDQCPSEAEVLNGISDTDGCPDNGGNAVATLDGNRLVLNTEVKFTNRNTVRNVRNIESIAAVMRSTPTVTKWRVVVAAKKKGDDAATRAASQAQADALRDALVSGGMSADAIEAIGAVTDTPTVAIAVATRQEVEDIEFVCPASLLVTGRQPPSDNAPAMPVTTSEPAPTPAPIVVEEPADMDNDGIVDADDKCPDQAETANSYQDDDGCPDTIPRKLKRFTGSVKGINFKTGSADIAASSLKLLKRTAKVLAEFPDIKVEISGHTDNVGDAAANKALSTQRAEAVLAALVAEGLPADMLSAVGFGDEKPVGDNNRSKGRKANRRIEFKILNK